MKLELDQSTARKLFPDVPGWFQKVLTETFGEKAFKKKDFRDIKTFEDACEELGIDPDDVYHSDDTVDENSYKKLKVIVKAINQGWNPDWDNTDQKKWWSWFRLSSGFGFDGSGYDYGCTDTLVGSRLCFETKEKSDYAAQQFIDLYKSFLK
jgi:hypothetical protein